MQVFISHASKDKDAFETLTTLLHASKVPYMHVTDKMRAARPLGVQLKAMIDACDVCIFIATSRSVEAGWCLAELGAFWGTGKRVIVYLADPSLELEKIPPQYHADFMERDIEKVICAAQDELENSWMRPNNRLRTAHVLAIGHTCWDTIIDSSELTRRDDRDAVGGSTYYGTHAISYMADQMQCQVSIDLLSTIAEDRAAGIRPMFLNPSIRTYFRPRQRTLSFLNRYPTTDGMDREQEVLTMPDAPISSRELEKETEIVEKVKEGWYDIVLLLPLTPHDFLDVANDMIPFLREKNPKVWIGLELQGLTRDVAPQGGPVGRKLSDSVPLLLAKGAISCAHASIKEARFVLEELDKIDHFERRWADSEPQDIERIARKLCMKGIRVVGLTDGGRGSCVAWQSPDSEFPPSKHIPTPTISGTAPTSYATGSGDTWFGIFTYVLFGLRFPPMVAGCLATQFATIKCQHKGAL